MPTIHAISTGLVQVRRAQAESRSTGIARITDMLFDKEWTAWLPIYAWVALRSMTKESLSWTHGETCRVHERGYHPAWHPFYRAGRSLLSSSG